MNPAPTTTLTAALTTHGLVVAIGGRTIVSGLDMTLAPGERLTILGRNGAGKTTLLHTLAGLRAPVAGNIALCGVSLAHTSARDVARRRGILLQQQMDAFPATVLETALVGRHPWLDRWAWESHADAALARTALAAVGLTGLEPRDVQTLSGGERQRLAIATLLTQAPPVALLDEPLSHLDLNHQMAVLDLFAARAREESTAVVMVLHDINLACRHADRALLLFDDGSHQLGSVAETFNAATLSRLYGHPLRCVVVDGQHYFIPE
jgi:iron complex transport system ATP-binding protein